MYRRTYTMLINQGLDLYRAQKFWEGYELMTENADHDHLNDAQVCDFRLF
ncbi:MAG: hypothetical protein SA339_03035 [Methanomassiliicoccus sp.]|nr:hypothetical protein [Methanomassiliicoccus sp.]